MLCFVFVYHLFLVYSFAHTLRLLHWYWGNLMIAPGTVKHSWRIWLNPVNNKTLQKTVKFKLCILLEICCIYLFALWFFAPHIPTFSYDMIRQQIQLLVLTDTCIFVASSDGFYGRHCVSNKDGLMNCCEPDPMCKLSHLTLEWYITMSGIHPFFVCEWQNQSDISINVIPDMECHSYNHTVCTIKTVHLTYIWYKAKQL